MMYERENPRAPRGPAQSQRLPRDLAVAPVKTIEKADRQNERPVSVARELVINLHLHEDLARREQRSERLTHTDERARFVAYENVTPRRAFRQRYDATGAKVGRPAQVQHDRRKRNDMLRRDQRGLRRFGYLLQHSCLIEHEWSGCLTHERSHVCRRSDCCTEIATKRANVGPFATRNTQPRRGRLFDAQESQSIDRDHARLALNALPFTGELVESS